MTIQFDRIGSFEKPFELKLEGVTFQGTLKKIGYHRVQLKAALDGSIELDCDRCGQSYPYILKSQLSLVLSDEILNDKEDLDIIEFLDGMIDIDYILKSEIEVQKSTYHYCPKCDESDELLEIEF